MAKTRCILTTLQKLCLTVVITGCIVFVVMLYTVNRINERYVYSSIIYSIRSDSITERQLSNTSSRQAAVYYRVAVKVRVSVAEAILNNSSPKHVIELTEQADAWSLQAKEIERLHNTTIMLNNIIDGDYEKQKET